MLLVIHYMYVIIYVVTLFIWLHIKSMLYIWNYLWKIHKIVANKEFDISVNEILLSIIQLISVKKN